MEQTARALNTICRRWQERLRNSPDLEHTAKVIRYHQAQPSREAIAASINSEHNVAL